ncbi:MAG: thermonuclease family protein [Zhengella sp.]|uniref:thermonuclease family protein n=1 Tax=Zhengella sp. TaxID=2282762 RepID=UPI001D86A107|nr:thermonuclease family protein [Notoacmeibacter sp.]MCC0025427.1 thermonuclease family protein [Brucellaceae bacterium]
MRLRYLALPVMLLAFLFAAMEFWPRIPVEPVEKLAPRNDGAPLGSARPRILPPSPGSGKTGVAPTGYDRVEPRAPLSPLAAPATPAPPPDPADRSAWKDRLLHKPVVLETNLLEADGQRLRLDGITTLPLDATCRDDEARDRPCGMMARTALRRWIRLRAISCRAPEKPHPAVIATSCTLGGEDVAAWLARQGWVTRADAPALEASLQDARREGRGLYAYRAINPPAPPSQEPR